MATPDESNRDGTVFRIPAEDVTLTASAFGDPEAPPVMLLHGGGQTRHSWHGTARHLSENGWYAIAVDLRGHGDSDWSPDGVYSIGRFAADVRAISRTTRRPPALVGASLGGIAGLLAMGDSGETVGAALVLVDVAPRIEPAGVDRISAFMGQGMHGFASLEDAADAIASYNPHRPRPSNLSGLTKNLRLHDDGRWYWHWDPKFFHATNDEAALDGLPEREFAPPERLEEAARRITAPTMLVRGASSDLLSEEGAQHLLTLIPHARYVDVAGAGHMVAGDRNDRFTTAVVEFLRDDVRPVMEAG